MNLWEILGLEPTCDLGAIRKAYAAKAAQCSPEDDPEGFLQIRRAYEEACAWARGQEQPDQPPLEPQQVPVNQGTGGFSLAEEEEQARPFAHPALDQFRELYGSKQRVNRKLWDQYFTSIEFLSVYRDPRFTAALRQTVEEMKKEWPPISVFQIPLAVAYRYRAVEYKDRTEFELAAGAGFDGIEDILKIAAMGPLVRKLQGNDKALSAAYRDYEALCGLARQEKWDLNAAQQMHKYVSLYSMAYLKERCVNSDLFTERNIVSLRVLEAFFSLYTLPEEAYEILWNTLELNSAVMGRAQILYGKLRQIAQEKAPQVCVPREQFVELRSAFIELSGQLYHFDADMPQNRELTDAFLARWDFQRAARTRMFVRDEILHHWCGPYDPHTAYFLRQLMALYQREPSFPYAREVVEAIQDSIDQWEKEEARKRVQENLGNLAREEITLDCCSPRHPLFLRYFLRNSFYHADTSDGKSLAVLLDQQFPQDAGWVRRLAEKKLSLPVVLHQKNIAEDGQEQVETLEFEIRFHQFYLEYRCDGQPVCNPVLPFWGLCQLEDELRFLMLLPVMGAYQEDLEQVKEILKERLARLNLPEEVLAVVSDALAREIACMAPMGDGVGSLRPAFFAREEEDIACFCEWYGNGRMLTFRRTAEGEQILHTSCYEDIRSLQEAARRAKKILDEIFLPAPGLRTIKPGLCGSIHADYNGQPSRDYPPEEISQPLLEQLFHDFEQQRVHRLVFDGRLVLLWDFEGQGGTCALLRFYDGDQRWEALLANRDMYCSVDSTMVPQSTFRLGHLPVYLLHRGPGKPLRALTAILSGAPERSEQWSTKVYLYSAKPYYYMVKRTIGCFTPEESRGPMLRARYFMPKTPHRFFYQKPDGELCTLPVEGAARMTLQSQLAGFEAGNQDYLVIRWQLEEEGVVHLVLLHEKAGTEHRYQAIVIQDNCQSIDYLVADRWEYINTDKKLIKAEFQGRKIPCYLIHYDMKIIRDFLDLFFISIPKFDPLLRNQFGAFASGPDYLTRLGFAEHRRKLLPPVY